MDRAREALQAALAGKNSRERGEEKRETVLKWLYRWGYASPGVLDMLTGAQRRGFAAKLARQGFVEITHSASGRALRGAPASFVTLTPLGLQAAERSLEPNRLLLPPVEPLRVPQALLRHNEFAQRATALRLLAGQISEYWTEREIATGANVKVPDVVWRPAGSSVRPYAVEIELTAKFDRRLDEFVGRCCNALATDQYNLVLVLSDSAALLERYRRAFCPGAKYGLWRRGESRHWHRVEFAEVPAEVSGRVMLRLIDDELQRLQRIRAGADLPADDDIELYELLAGTRPVTTI